MLPGSYPHGKYIYGLYGLKHCLLEKRGGVTDAGEPTNLPNLVPSVWSDSSGDPDILLCVKSEKHLKI